MIRALVTIGAVLAVCAAPCVVLGLGALAAAGDADRAAARDDAGEGQ